MMGLITRRDFLKAAVAGGVLVPVASAQRAHGVAKGTSKVVLIRDEKVLDERWDIVLERLGNMLDDGLMALLGKESPLKAWSAILRPNDIVGIKSNVWHYLPTPRELEEAIRQRVLAVGVKPENVSVDDRGVRGNPIFQKATALINVRPLRTHFWSGIGGCIKNYIMFVPTPAAYHEDGCANLGSIWNEPLVKGKTRVNILCALTPQFYGRGPHFFDRRYVWPYKGLILSLDPVAADTVGAALLAAKRLDYFGEDRPLDVTPHHIEVAEHKYHLGVSDLRRIELIRLGWPEGSLL